MKEKMNGDIKKRKSLMTLVAIAIPILLNIAVRREARTVEEIGVEAEIERGAADMNPADGIA
eukprot:CAMPEP_0201107744 /NCGR_PEP_ID=MMETSP0812-20130820/58133_1 /ASSEMBLY_ACC=CAM_ASM_000668 /TAXON_ID=98059 /ORGANISM="Dinobryon sp., Strain UTEXLB2267" /LENGTH=61 /DNA_ID=CAMNT_0047368811 /DNA_START=29 /DNA_END=210 /DNA_ORIENTATION=+